MIVGVKEGSIQKSTADTIVVNLFEDVTNPGGATGAVDSALEGAISELVANGDLSGAAGEVGILYPRGAIPAKRVLVVGLGKADNFDQEGVRKAAATAIKRAGELG
ncbi:MAG: M17 family peptidase N-terminal domain-containing protein, partial [Candidatus Promineifilaceae bacterium]